MKTLTIKTHAENKREHEFFQAIITLAGSVLAHDWRIVESDPADVVIISFDSTEPYSAWDEYSGRYPLERLVAYTDENRVNGAKWHLPRASESMPRLSEVVKVLNNVGEYFSDAEKDFPAPGEIRGSFAPPAFSETEQAVPFAEPESFVSIEAAPFELPSPPALDVAVGGQFQLRDYLAGTIEEALEQGGCWVCAKPGYSPVYLFPKENAVYTAADSSSLSSLCRAERGDIEVRALSEAELLEEVRSHGLVRRRSLSEFLWFSILAGSDGKMLAGCDVDEPVYLREWPGYVRLSFYAMYHGIATQMAAGMASLKDVAHRSGAPLQNVIDFHNACAFLGLVARGEEGRRLAAQKIQSQERLRSVLRPYCSGRYVKLVIVGSVGSGKTTALTALSETPPLLTETSPSDGVASRKSTTTVAMEYGEIRINSDSKLQIYGTPGQKRFDFMGQILCNRAWGLLILLDNTEPNPLAELKYYLDMYVGSLASGNVAVGISHYDAAQTPSIQDYQDFLGSRGHAYPLGAVDARDINSLVSLLCALAGNGAPPTAIN